MLRKTHISVNDNVLALRALCLNVYMSNLTTFMIFSFNPFVETLVAVKCFFNLSFY